MWKFNSLHLFLARFKKLDLSRQILASISILLATLYPGQNSLQTLVINPGKVYAYSLPKIDPFIYPLSDGINAPYVSAKSVVVQDAVGKSILYSKNPDLIMMPASITKVMTALVALDYWGHLDTVIEVKNEDRAIGQTIDLVKGERITIRNILYGLLVHSGNDAALAVAENYEGGYDAFVIAMNQKAKELHLDHTTYKNPSGVEQYGHTTTARDIAVLSSYALKNPEIARIVEIKRIIVTDVTGLIVHDLETTNELLGEIPGLKGLKTGWTSGAGECLVSYVDRDNKQIIIVVLGSLSRFGDTRLLIDWVYGHHDWIIPSI